MNFIYLQDSKLVFKYIKIKLYPLLINLYCIIFNKELNLLFLICKKISRKFKIL